MIKNRKQHIEDRKNRKSAIIFMNQAAKEKSEKKFTQFFNFEEIRWSWKHLKSRKGCGYTVYNHSLRRKDDLKYLPLASC